MDRALRDALFEAIEAYCEEHKLGYVAAGARLGIPGWQMTRWFSEGSKSYSGWTNPKPHILEKLVLADLDPISSIALALLQGEHAIPGDFDFTRAAATFGFSCGLPCALISALTGKAKPTDLVRTAAFDLVSAFANSQFFTELAAASINGLRSSPVHPFGMITLSDPYDLSWPATMMGHPLLDLNFGDEQMHKQLSVVDNLLSAGTRESNELYNRLEQMLRVTTLSMASEGDISLAVTSADIARNLCGTTHKMAKIYRDAADRQPALAKLPLHRLASKVFEICNLTSRYSLSSSDYVFSYANSVLGKENVEMLIKTPNEQMAPMIKRSSGGYTTCGMRVRIGTTPLPRMRSSPITSGDKYYLTTGSISELNKMSVKMTAAEREAREAKWR